MIDSYTAESIYSTAQAWLLTEVEPAEATDTELDEIRAEIQSAMLETYPLYEAVDIFAEIDAGLADVGGLR